MQRFERAGRWRAAATAAALLFTVSSTSASPVRIHAIGYRHLVSDAESAAAYRDHLVGLADAAVAADTEAPDGAERVLVFPENTALYAMFLGARGVPFRALHDALKQGGGNGGLLAVAGLFAAYQDHAAYYRVKFPAENGSQARLAQLALTDVLYRSFFETFREIAIRHGAWVVTSANVAPALVQTNPAIAAILGDPEAAGRGCIGPNGAAIPWPCAYEAATADVYNQAFVFRPDGTLVFNPLPEAREGDLDGAIKKTYLVPIEQGPLEQGKTGLDLAYGSLRQVRPIEIAGIPMGIVISKPAWMLDELGRLEAYDAQVMLQPEAFSIWGLPEAGDSSWAPDVLKQSGWSHTQKYGPFRYSVLAELTGNFFDLTFDAQSHVVRKATSKSTLGESRYVGQPDDTGWVEASPWVVGDRPGETCDRPTLAERRACLAAVAAKLLPGSGDPLENAYREDAIAATLDLAIPVDAGPALPGALGTDAPLVPGEPGRQRSPDVALAPDGETAYVVWQDDRSGLDQIRIARVHPDGTIDASRPVSENPGSRQIDPQVAVAPDGTLHVVWQELSPVPRLRRASAPSGNEAFGDAGPVGLFAIPGIPATPLDEQWTPAIDVDASGHLHVAWIALLEGFERLHYTRIETGPLETTETTTRLDDEAFPAPNALATGLNNRWNPTIAARTLAGGEATVAIAWTDFRDYAWDLYATISTDGGETFSPHVRVDDSRTAHERLHDDPTVQVAADGTIRIAWTDQGGRRLGCPSCPERRRPDADVAFTTIPSGPVALVVSPNVRIDDTGDGLANEPAGDRRGFSGQWRPALAEDPESGRLVAVWQDHREGNNDVFLATSDDGGTTWSANRRIDATGDGPSNQIDPALAAGSQGLLTVVWEDDREGVERIYHVRGTLP